MARNRTKPAQSYYRGIRVSITQSDLERPCLVTVATKHLDKHWDEWDLLFPAIRVPIPVGVPDDYTFILRLVADAVEALIAADKQYR